LQAGLEGVPPLLLSAVDERGVWVWASPARQARGPRSRVLRIEPARLARVSTLGASIADAGIRQESRF